MRQFLFFFFRSEPKKCWRPAHYNICPPHVNHGCANISSFNNWLFTLNSTSHFILFFNPLPLPKKIKKMPHTPLPIFCRMTKRAPGSQTAPTLQGSLKPLTGKTTSYVNSTDSLRRHVAVTKQQKRRIASKRSLTSLLLSTGSFTNTSKKKSHWLQLKKMKLIFFPFPLSLFFPSPLCFQTNRDLICSWIQKQALRVFSVYLFIWF